MVEINFIKNLYTPMHGASILIRVLGIRGACNMQSTSSLHGPSGAWTSVTMLYYRKNNKKPKAIRPLFAITQILSIFKVITHVHILFNAHYACWHISFGVIYCILVRIIIAI